MVFEDNRLLPVLFGEQNAHLSQIEKALNVAISNRGNELHIEGNDGDVKNAKAILNNLWDKILAGEDIDKHSVDAALRFLNAESKGDISKDEVRNFTESQIQIHTKKKKITPRTPLQAAYMKMMRDYNMVFGIGPAGTGKTYLAVAMAVQMMEEGAVERIILSRPAVEAGERLGFLPGELKEKMDPYMRPLYDSLHDTMAIEKVQKKMATEEIEIAPLAYMRGRTLNNAFVILDEAQNATEQQMLMFLTRMGENSRMVITGDPSQIDLPANTGSGLIQASRFLENENDIGFIYFTSKDVVRNKLVTKVIQAYEKHKKSGIEKS